MVYLRLLYGFIGRLYDLLAAILIATLIIGAQAIPGAYALSESQITDQTVAAEGTITMDAVIDGRSQLILHGNMAQWLHLDFAASVGWKVATTAP